MRKLLISMFAVVALLGLVIAIPTTANAAGVNGQDVNCGEHATHYGEGSATVAVSEKQLNLGMRVSSQTNPIPELGGDPQVVSTVRQYCQETVNLKLVVTKDGKKAATLRVSGQSDPQTGYLSASNDLSKKMPLKEGKTKYCFRVIGKVTDPDQTVANIKSKKTCAVASLTIKTKTVQLF